MNELKRHLFDAYGGFADKRIKNLDKSSRYIVDDRGRNDHGADKSLYPWFCPMFADVVGPRSVAVRLTGNVPMSAQIAAWIEAGGYQWQDGRQAQLEVVVGLGNEQPLDELAKLVEDITRPGAPRYEVASYKYVCPRVAKCLRDLAGHLRSFGTEAAQSA